MFELFSSHCTLSGYVVVRALPGAQTANSLHVSLARRPSLTSPSPAILFLSRGIGGQIYGARDMHRAPSREFIAPLSHLGTRPGPAGRYLRVMIRLFRLSCQQRFRVGLHLGYDNASHRPTALAHEHTH